MYHVNVLCFMSYRPRGAAILCCGWIVIRREKTYVLRYKCISEELKSCASHMTSFVSQVIDAVQDTMNIQAHLSVSLMF